jgi:DNA topoisomerase-1
MPLGKGLRFLVAARLSEIDARAINSLPIGRDAEGCAVVARVGRYGAYLQRGDDTARLPDDIPPDELTLERALELLQAPNGDRELGLDPATGLPVLVRTGRFGSYVQLGKGGTGKDKPKTGSLLRSMSPETLTLDDALRLLALPREVGVDPQSGETITAQLGRYGPYVARGSDSRGLEHEEDVFTINLEQALTLFAQPRQRRVRAAAALLAEFGEDPHSGKQITLREGRFGLYVTDGEINASLRRGDTPESLTPERAQELLQLRRERGPVKRKRSQTRTAAGTKKKSPRRAASSKRKPSKSTSSGRATAKAAAKKSTARKAAAKKSTARKAAAKKSTARKAAAKKSTARKAAAKKSMARKAAAKKKPSSKKTVGKKAAGAEPKTQRKIRKTAGKSGESVKRAGRSTGASLSG